MWIGHMCPMRCITSLSKDFTRGKTSDLTRRASATGGRANIDSMLTEGGSQMLACKIIDADGSNRMAILWSQVSLAVVQGLELFG